MPSDNLTVGGRLYVPVLIIDADGGRVFVRVPDAMTPDRQRSVKPYVCTDCCAIVTDPAKHNTVHDGPACRVCGCTEENACVLDDPEGRGLSTCFWVEPDLCSNPDCVAASRPVEKQEVVDLVAALRASVEAATARRKEQDRG